MICENITCRGDIDQFRHTMILRDLLLEETAFEPTFVLLLGVVCFAIAIRGGGPYSVDNAIGKELYARFDWR